MKANATSATTDAVARNVSRTRGRGPTPLERLVVDPATFAERVWGRIPLVIPAVARHDDWSFGAGAVGGLLSVDDVDGFVSSGIRLPAIRMVSGGEVLDAVRYCTPTRLGGRSVPEVVDGGKVAAQIADGATLVLQSLHRQWAPIVDFADGLMAEIGHPVQVNAYLTPSNASGLRDHHDDHDVFVVQMEGSKHWIVAGLGDVDLGVGDVLYIPAGCDHAAATTNDLSLHLTIGILRMTYRQVLERALVDGPPVLDRSLPLAFHRAGSSHAQDLEAGVAEMLTEVIDHLASTDVTEVVDRERRRQLVPYSRRGHLRSVLVAPELTQDSVVRWVTVVPRVQPVKDEPEGSGNGRDTGRDRRMVRVLLADRVLRMPTAAIPAMEAVSSAPGGIRVRDLPGLDAPSRVVVARRLVIEGACIIDPL